MKPLAIKTIQEKFPHQWLLIEVTDTQDGAPSKGVLLKAGHTRHEVLEEITRNKGKKLFFCFSGIRAQPDTAFALYVKGELQLSGK